MEVDNQHFDESNLPTEEEVEIEARKIGRKTFNIFNVAPVEMKKFWFMVFQFFLISYIYAILRELKDGFTLKRQLPASISVMKLAYVPPVSIIASALVAKFLTFSTNQNILLVFLGLYAIYFLAYGLVILPFQDAIEPSTFLVGDYFLDGKMSFRGMEYFGAFCLTLTCWTSTLHFVMSEVWGSTVFVLLFLSHMNDVCPMKQFIRFIPVFYIFSNVSLIFSFFTLKLHEIIDKNLTYVQRNRTLYALFVFLALMVCVIFAVGFYLKHRVLNRPLFIIQSEKKKKKSKIGFLEGIKLMFRSRLVLAICIMTLSYNIGTNLVEQNYKTAVKARTDLLGSSTSETVGFLAYQQLFVGAIVILLLITPFSKLIQRTGWTAMGLVPPICAIFAFFCVLAFALFNTSIAHTNLGFINTLVLSFTKNLKEEQKKNLLTYEVYTGLAFVSLFKITKYAAFDIAKETLSMKINKKYRSRFKGIYDGVCGKVGKAGGALIQLIATIFMNTKDVRESSFFYLIISAFILAVWFSMVLYLGRMFQASVKSDSDIDIDLIGKNKSFDDDEVEPEQPSSKDI